MTITAWRIVKRRYEATAFDGEGAFQFGGRWNSPGKRVIYTSQSVSLVLLEMLVHVGSALLPSYNVIPTRFEDDLAVHIELHDLPDSWRSHPGPPELKKLGDDWIARLSSPVLRVPSAVVPSEWNYLLNPGHSGFAKITIGEPVPIDIDLRMLGRTPKRPRPKRG